jgi:hypothetical protein
MKMLRFEGYSDDTFGEIVTGVDYDNCGSGRPIILKVWSAKENDGLYVVGQYCPDPMTGWMIGVGRLNEDDDAAMPDWQVRLFRSERPYSPSLLIDAPDDVMVEIVT